MRKLTEVVPPGARLAIDTSPFIYYIEGGSEVDASAVELFEACLETGRNQAVTSVVTLAEVLVQPLGLGRTDLASRYREFLVRGTGLRLLGVTPEIAERAAAIRARYEVRLPDAFQLATALQAAASHFITNDGALRRFDECSVVVLSDLVR